MSRGAISSREDIASFSVPKWIDSVQFVPRHVLREHWLSLAGPRVIRSDQGSKTATVQACGVHMHAAIPSMRKASVHFSHPHLLRICTRMGVMHSRMLLLPLPHAARNVAHAGHAHAHAHARAHGAHWSHRGHV